MRGVAQVHVHVRSTKPKAAPGKRFVHWADRALLSVVMGVVAFGLERAVVRSTKKSAPTADAGDGTGAG